MTTTQCPKCPLRYSTRNEALWHLRQDHPPDHRPTPAGPAGQAGRVAPKASRTGTLSRSTLAASAAAGRGALGDAEFAAAGQVVTGMCGDGA